jgi:hypothetical protein
LAEIEARADRSGHERDTPRWALAYVNAAFDLAGEYDRRTVAAILELSQGVVRLWQAMGRWDSSNPQLQAFLAENGLSEKHAMPLVVVHFMTQRLPPGVPWAIEGLNEVLAP